MGTAKERRIWIVVVVIVLMLTTITVWFLSAARYEVGGNPIVNGPYQMGRIITLYDLEDPERPLVGLVTQDPANVQNDAYFCAIHHPDDWPNPMVIEVKDADHGQMLFGYTIHPVYRVYPFGIRRRVGEKSVFTLYFEGGEEEEEETGGSFHEPRYSTDRQVGHEEKGDYLVLSLTGGPLYPNK